MALMDDILSEILTMDNEEKKRLLDYLRNEKYVEHFIKIEPIDINSMGYLDGLSRDALDYVKLVLENYSLNLYHSAAAIIQGNHGNTLQGKFDYYMKKYQNKRPWMIGHEKTIKEIFNHVCKKLGRKDLLPRNNLKLLG